MAHSDLIDSLIATYRNLNLTIRPLPDEQANQATAGGTSLRELVTDLRDQELVASQQLKLMTLADSTIAGQALEILPVAEGLSVRAILSEFGTAREAILALIREMPEEGWTAEREGPNGRTSIESFVEQLVARDSEVMGRIEPLTRSGVS